MKIVGRESVKQTGYNTAKLTQPKPNMAMADMSAREKVVNSCTLQ